jgi:peptidoglycan/LPS O-acetylase OafA/YrhL
VPIVGDAATGVASTRPNPPRTYIPSLDGVRAVAVLGVMAFHSGLPFLPGGFLGVDAFFVLSGFLITTLLVDEWRKRGAIRLLAFWARRARRLLPALFLVIVFVVCYAAFVVPQGTYPDVRSDALAALFYVANWHFIAAGNNYFVQTGAVSPLTHTWSLAVEEQFYVVWPLLVLAVVRLFLRLRPLLVVTVAGALGSSAEMFVLFRHGAGLTRLYYGTDTHAQGLMVGAALAVALAMVPRHRHRAPGADLEAQTPAGRGCGGPESASRQARRALLLIGGAGVAVDAMLWWRATYQSSFLWQGGFLLADVATAAVLLSAVCLPNGPLSRVLSATPLRFVGRISYGMYLWHFPLFQWADQARTGLTGYPLFGMRLAITVLVSTASYFFIEQPIRRGQVLQHWRARLAAPFVAGAVVGFVVLATSGAGAVAPNVPTSVPVPVASSGSGTTGRTVMVVGDSTALTLGADLTVAASSRHATIVDKAILGCGIAEFSEVADPDGDARAAQACNPHSPAGLRWPALWEKWVATLRPSVVAILAGRWETSNVLWHGMWTNITDRAFAGYVRRQLERAVGIASSGGAHVDLLTAPCYSAGTQPSTAPLPGDSPRRLSVYNHIVRAVAQANPKDASLVDLGGLVCPGGHYRARIGDVTVRAPDGVHFPFFSMSHPTTPDPDTVTEVRRFGWWLGRTLWPRLLSPEPSLSAARPRPAVRPRSAARPRPAVRPLP